MWSKKICDYDHLRVFDCNAYNHIKDGKLKPTTIKCIFLGYPEDIKGYKLWLDKLGKQKYFFNRDVVFNKLEITKPRKTTLEVEQSD